MMLWSIENSKSYLLPEGYLLRNISYFFNEFGLNYFRLEIRAAIFFGAQQGTGSVDSSLLSCFSDNLTTRVQIEFAANLTTRVQIDDASTVGWPKLFQLVECPVGRVFSWPNWAKVFIWSSCAIGRNRQSDHKAELCLCGLPKMGVWPKISDSSWPKVCVWPKVGV